MDAQKFYQTPLNACQPLVFFETQEKTLRREKESSAAASRPMTAPPWRPFTGATPLHQKGTDKSLELSNSPTEKNRRRFIHQLSISVPDKGGVEIPPPTEEEASLSPKITEAPFPIPVKEVKPAPKSPLSSATVHTEVFPWANSMTNRPY